MPTTAGPRGRWDDPGGRFRTLYVADQLLGCLLEGLADFRPDLLLLAQLQDIADVRSAETIAALRPTFAGEAAAGGCPIWMPPP